MMDKIKLIMIGNKARQGKDVLANFLRNKLENAFILHFADPLKAEVSEKNKLPLIFRKHANGKNYYFLRDIPGVYRTYTAEEMPLLDKVFTERGINEYYRMEEKDSLILQIWGTDFRRKLDTNYWVKKLDVLVANVRLSLNDEPGYIIVSDCRFINEFDYCKDNNGLYIRVMRMLKDGTQFIDTTREPTHKSEIELDNVLADYVSIAYDGDMKDLESNSNEFIKKYLKGAN